MKHPTLPRRRAPVIGWLRTFAPTTCVGIRGTASDCVFARYLRVMGLQAPRVYGPVYGNAEWGREIVGRPTPPWIQRTLQVLDAAGMALTEITAAEALAALGEEEAP